MILPLSKIKIWSFFIFSLIFFFSFSSYTAQSNIEEGLYSHISDLTISSPVCNSRYNRTYFDLNLVIELYSTLSYPFTIYTPDSVLFVPKTNVSFVDDSNQFFLLYTLATPPAEYVITPNTSTYIRKYTFAFKFDDVCFTRMPEGNYTIWLELAGPSPIPYRSFYSFIYVNETSIDISHEYFDSNLFTIPEYSNLIIGLGVIQLLILSITLIHLKRKKRLN